MYDRAALTLISALVVFEGTCFLLDPTENVQTFFQQSASERILADEKRTVGPKGLLYVNQREFAATLPDDGVFVAGGFE